MPCAAEDFRIFWDNAYCVHHLYDDVAEQDQLLDIGAACREAGNPHRPFKFASTSKVTHPGAGISALAASPENVAEIKKRLGVGTIGYDKINQLRHVRFLKDAEGLAAHMSKHAAILRPKFELVLTKLDEGLVRSGRMFVVASARRLLRVVRRARRHGQAHRPAGEGGGRDHDGRRGHLALQARPA